MARIRKLSIRNFRSIQSLDWYPSPGINCLVGPGDSGKSSILDAIDLCLGARRSAPFGDTDFYRLDVNVPIEIAVTLGELSDDLMNIESYGDFLQGFNAATNQLEEEPGDGLEPVLTLRLRVESDLEPEWTLISARAEAHGLSRGLHWKDRTSIAPARIGAYAHTNLSWSRNSVLNKLTHDRADLGVALADAGRVARTSFGQQAAEPLAATLGIVTQTANTLGVPVGDAAQALLDAHSVSIGDGAIALHNADGIPLRSLGTGSSRLLIAGLQRKAGTNASIALVDEVEYGLEPHRLIRFLDSLGAKHEDNPPLQAFITTHSPVAIRELSGDQLFIVRSQDVQHVIHLAGSSDEIQGTLRSASDAFLAKFVLVCEGSSEVGFVRGMDQFGVEVLGQDSLYASGGALVVAGGGSPDVSFNRGLAFLKLGYKSIVIIDSDKPPTNEIVAEFVKLGGKYVMWQDGNALEDELFASLNDEAVDLLIAIAKEIHGADLIDQHIQSMSDGQNTLDGIEATRPNAPYSAEVRVLLGRAAKNKNNGWFKTLGRYQRIAKQVVFPHFDNSRQEFQNIVNELRGHINAAARA